jgi:hypothetical protein
MTYRTFLFYGNDSKSLSPLWLEEVEREKNKIVRAYVINGLWNLEIKGKEMSAKGSFGSAITKWKPKYIVEVNVPNNVAVRTNDYNTAIAQAYEFLPKKYRKED